MSLTPVIPKERPDHPSLDYEVLRAEGIRHLENLATELWTDFNAHDPGITFLELLSYAITDLGYRTRKLPIADLLAGGKEKAFFEVPEILPCAPVTACDYRKLLIDVEGVKNAWVEKYTGIAIFTDKGHAYGLWAEDKFRFRGIGVYDPENGTWTPDHQKILAFLEEYYREYPAKGKKDKIDEALKWIDMWASGGVSRDTCACIGFDPDALFDPCQTPEKCPVPEIPEPLDESEQCALLFALLCRYGYTSLSLKTIDDTNEDDPHWLHLNGLVKLTLDLDDEIDPENESETRPIVERAMKRLHANRFLGHDYLEPPLIVGKLPVAVCLHIEVKNGVNVVDAAAEALWQIEQHLTPTLRFYTFKEMLAKGYGIDDIYNGPLLDHGFLDNAEVDKAQLLTHFRHSDLTNAATADPHVLNVLELKVKVYPDKQFQVKTAYQIFSPNPAPDADPKNPTELSRPLKPVIDLCASCIYVTQNGRRCEIREEALADALNLKRLLAECHDTPGGPELPVGLLRPDLSEYRSVQYDLPGVYGVGDFGVTSDTPAHKKGARKQLQAYLAFFDQILAAYLLQLGEVRRLFAVEQDPTLPTYQTADLGGIPGMPEIIDKTKPFSVESQATREDRRNRLLDHLLARFGEAFSDYAAALAGACKGSKNNGFSEDFADFLQAKADFLREIPDLGYGRGKAYNYRGGKDKKVWNTANVAGVKKRVHRLLGLKGSWAQQSLLTKPAYRLDIVQVTGKQGVKQYQIVFKVLPENLPPDADIPFGGALLRSPRYTSLKATQDKRDDLYSHIWNKDLYNTGAHPREDDQQTVLFTLNGKMELYGDPLGETEAEDLLEYILDLVSFETGSDKEGFHVLEHILLRPNDPDDQLLEIALGCEPQYTPNDPYSSWLSVVLPAWPDRFADPAFRKHFEQTFRREMPAELAARFCWFDKEKMREFEERYMAWMEAKAACTPDECHVTEAANALIEWLNLNPCSCSCHHCCEADEACDECRECDNEQLKLKNYAG